MRVVLPGTGGLATYIVCVPCASASARPGVDHSVPSHYSTIWCLCYRTNKLKKKEEGGNRPGQIDREKG
jgi:hypothetical protein